ncbi:hypothetical protein F5Y15DRAFT_285547 [Xylariaceae sp. FL0016]|nr:hypothetical protein F5Y15DRAFT_285547 [Xylariaceae sp. FL0016]
MRRKNGAAAGGKGMRVKGAASGPTPVPSTLATPLSSALSSSYPSEVETDATDANDEVAKLPMGALSLGEGSSALTKIKQRRIKQKPFRFLALPSELRIKVYDYHFANTGYVLDLDPDNYKKIHQKLAILRVCRTIYVEASHHFYSTHPVRIFPCHPGKFFKTKKPLLARMKKNQLASISSLELRLGPGWSQPPRGWVVNPALGLNNCISVHKVCVFVECDPGNDIFKGFRQPNGFFEKFARGLLEGVLDQMPWIERVEFDAWSSVKKTGNLMTGLIDLVTIRGIKITWGSLRGWTDEEEVEPPPIVSNYAPLLITPQTNHNIVVMA